MANMADDIEQFLKQLIGDAGSVELQRATLAAQFGCAPSQINYVLSTRFSPERGYIVESRRGGGGYLRITRLHFEIGDDLDELVNQQIGTQVTQDEALGYIYRLHEQNIIGDQAAVIMRAVVQRETLGLELPVRDILRASLLKAMILAALRY